MIKKVIETRKRNLGDFSVRRVLPNSEQLMVGPWIFFDHMGPVNFESGKGVDVRPHPHINLATVTYLFEGEIYHQDSLGNQQSIYPGDINLMVAGSGIVHSERERDEVRHSQHPLHGLQLWHALPDDQEEVEPSFHHYEASNLPEVRENDVTIRVMMGHAYGVTSPVRTFCDTLYAEAKLPKDKLLYLPQTTQLAIYVVSGVIKINDQVINPYEMVVFEDDTLNKITASEASQVAIIGGDKLGDRYIEWNFVSSKKERIEQAKKDWLEMKFNLIPSDHEDFIPLPE